MRQWKIYKHLPPSSLEIDIEIRTDIWDNIYKHYENGKIINKTEQRLANTRIIWLEKE